MKIGNLGCAGPSSCAFNTQPLTTGVRACSGDISCNENAAKLEAVGENSCKGDGSCSQNGPASGTVLEEPMVVRIQGRGCEGEGSCRQGQGNAELMGCAGMNSCQEWKVEYTTGANALQLGGVSFTVGEAACAGANSCQVLSAGGSGFYIGADSCTGANACQNIVADGKNFTIGARACSGTNSCQNCKEDVPDDAADCNGGGGGGSGGSSSGGNSGSSSSGAEFSAKMFGSGISLLVSLVAL